MEKKENVITCMMAGPDNEGLRRNPLWGKCRYCCSYCAECYKYLTPKCTRERCDFCAWRTDEETLVFIDIFGDGYSKQVYRDNMKKKDRWVGT